MGQSSIHMLNKTSYSMFWNSMWDNKNLYTRMLKESIFLNKFFSLSFGDSLSVNILSFKKKEFSKYKNNFQVLDLKKSSLYKHLYNLNKIKYYSAKLWVLRYQKWIILYHFIYIIDSDKLFFNPNTIDEDSYNDNIYYLMSFYKKTSKKLKSLFLKKKVFKINKF